MVPVKKREKRNNTDHAMFSKDPIKTLFLLCQIDLMSIIQVEHPSHPQDRMWIEQDWASSSLCVWACLCVRARRRTCVCVLPLLPLQSPFAPVTISRIVSVRHRTLWKTGSVLAVKIGLSQVSCEQGLDICSGLWLIMRMLTWRIALAAYLLWIPTSQGVIDGNVSLLNYFLILEWIGIFCKVQWRGKISKTRIKTDASDLLLSTVYFGCISFQIPHLFSGTRPLVFA